MGLSIPRITYVVSYWDRLFLSSSIFGLEKKDIAGLLFFCIFKKTQLAGLRVTYTARLFMCLFGIVLTILVLQPMVDLVLSVSRYFSVGGFPLSFLLKSSFHLVAIVFIVTITFHSMSRRGNPLPERTE